MIAAPLGFLTGSGERATTIVPLTWFMLAVSIVVCVTIAALLGIAMRRSTRSPAKAITVERGGDGLRWIKWGLALSAPPLLISLVWTMAALGRVAGPPANAGLTIDVTPHQYWWEARYGGPEGSFATANEIHIPTGTRVLIRLHGADVIHSFWVPQLSGKTDAIPGQVNPSWIAAS